MWWRCGALLAVSCALLLAATLGPRLGSPARTPDPARRDPAAHDPVAREPVTRQTVARQTVARQTVTRQTVAPTGAGRQPDARGGAAGDPVSPRPALLPFVATRGGRPHVTVTPRTDPEATQVPPPTTATAAAPPPTPDGTEPSPPQPPTPEPPGTEPPTPEPPGTEPPAPEPPGTEPPAPETPGPGPTAQPGARLAITYLRCRARDEVVRVENLGTVADDLALWTIVSAVGDQRFAFPAHYLQPGEGVSVHSGPDASPGGDDRYRWTRRAVWNNGGDEARLLDPRGHVVSQHPCDDVPARPARAGRR